MILTSLCASCDIGYNGECDNKHLSLQLAAGGEASGVALPHFLKVICLFDSSREALDLKLIL